VLAGRPLRPGARRAGTSRFSDDVWDLTPALLQRHKNALILNFPTLPARFRQAAKDLCYALLAGDLPPGERESTPDTIRVYFTALKQFFTWAGQRGILALRAVTAVDLDAYNDHLLASGRAVTYQAQRRQAVRLLWLYAGKLTDDALTFDPALVPSWADAPASSRTAENATPRIPEQVISPLLTWALVWINEFAGDVIAALEEWRLLHANTQPNRARRHAPARTNPAGSLEQLLQRYRAEHRPLPGGKDGRPVLAHLAREVGCTPGAFRSGRCRDLLAAAAAELGTADGAYLRTEITGRIGGQPWITQIPYAAAEHLGRLLQAAAWVTVACLSGMRDSEVKHLRRGCLSVSRAEDGRVYRRKIASLAFKGEYDPVGVPATWIVGEPVEMAVQVLERLHPDRDAYLSARLPGSQRDRRSHGTGPKSTGTTNDDLAAFTDWINDFCQKHGCPDGIPLVCGRRWRLTTRQFRRSLAWSIARRPGGVIAGSIAYRHHRVQMFEGYAGTSASGFRAEVEAEEAIARGEQLGDLITGHGHHQLAGPAAAEAEARLTEFGRHVTFHGKIITDPRRLKRIMDRHDPSIYPGQYVTCVYNPDRALCQRRDGAEGPCLPDCQPLACRNVALTSANIAALTRHQAHLGQALKGPGVIAPYVRHRLEEQHTEITAFLTSHQPDPGHA